MVLEYPVADVVVEVFDAVSHQKVDQDVTNAAGEYNIDYLHAGEFYFTFNPPSGYAFTIPNVGGELNDSDVDPSAGNGERSTRSYDVNYDQDYFNIDSGVVFGVLPVDWLNINAIRIDESFNRILWATAQEINASHFELERSLNGKAWTTIGRVESNGNTTNESRYSFDDIDSENAGVYQYRIKQVDLDGAYDYSKTVRIDVEGKADFDLYPNPTTGIVNLDLYVNEATEFTVDVFDVEGRLILSKAISEDFDRGEHTRTVDLTNLQSGVYNFRIVMNEKVINQNIILVK